MEAVKKDCLNCTYHKSGESIDDAYELCWTCVDFRFFNPTSKAIQEARNKMNIQPHNTSKDPISPSHYQQGNIEVIDFIKDQKMNYCEGNVIKYVSRYKYKNGLEDLKKAKQYLEWLILEQEQKISVSGVPYQVKMEDICK